MAKQEYEFRNPDFAMMTREEKQENIKRMLATAGLNENDIEVQKVDTLTGKELNAYYKKYDAMINKYKNKL